jgi:hypothetical protein
MHRLADIPAAHDALRVRDRYVGPHASLLVADFSWLYVLQPDLKHAGQRRAGELSRFRAGHLVTMHNQTDAI